MRRNLSYLLLARATHIFLLFVYIPIAVNHTFNATPPERLQQCRLAQTQMLNFCIT